MNTISDTKSKNTIDKIQSILRFFFGKEVAAIHSANIVSDMLKREDTLKNKMNLNDFVQEYLKDKIEDPFRVHIVSLMITDVINEVYINESRFGINKILSQYLKLWMLEGMEAPVNELNSIQSWLATLSEHGKEETCNRMRQRILLLMHAANELNDLGRDAENIIGIYEHRPDLIPPEV